MIALLKLNQREKAMYEEIEFKGRVPHHEKYGYGTMEIGKTIRCTTDENKVVFMKRVHSYGQHTGKKFSCCSTVTSVVVRRTK